MLIAFQVLVMLLTCALWWRARQDLAARSAAGASPPLADWERLRTTVEQLTVDLERRAVVAEQRVAAAEARLQGTMASRSPSVRDEEGHEKPVFDEKEHVPDSAALDSLAPQNVADPDRFTQAERLAAGGVSDPTELARQAGVTRGEAELLLSLRGRRAL